MKKMEADVVVVALGLSGLATSIAAAEQGLSVIGFEKANVTGGAANMGMGPFAVESRPQKEAQVPLTREEAYKIHMEFAHYKCDARLVHDYYWKSADTIDWLMGMGVNFVVQRYYPGAYQTAHNVIPENGKPGHRGAGTMVRRMTERATELGVDMQFSTPVKKIIMEDGKAVGVIAVDKDGEEIEARAKAVVIATGGMGSNTKLLKEAYGMDMGDVTFMDIGGITGDGVRMAWEAGVKKGNITFDWSVSIVDNLNHMDLEGAFRAKPELMVNKNGERFINEEVGEAVKFTANAIMRQKGQCAYVIFDNARLKYLKKHGPDVIDQVHGFEMYDKFEETAKQTIASGYPDFCMADSIEELADKMGINKENLLETIEDYNLACETGRDTFLSKSPKYLNPVKKAPFYCCRMVVQTIGPLGGIKINHKLQALDQNDEPIPGLYAVGTDACDIYGPDYPLMLTGNTMGFCLNGGRLAAEYISDYIDDLED